MGSKHDMNQRNMLHNICTVFLHNDYALSK